LSIRLNDVTDEARHGISAATALALIPSPAPGKNFSVGLGVGNFRGAKTAAGNATMRIPNTGLLFSLGGSLTGEHKVAGAGLSWSF